MKSTNSAMLTAAITGLLAASIGSPSKSIAQTALDTYVAAPDSSYGYTVADYETGPDGERYWIELTSQNWRSDVTQDYTGNSEWQHSLSIAQPATLVSNNTAVLMIGVGNTPGSYDNTEVSVYDLDNLVDYGLTIVYLPAVPNMPLLFEGESETRRQDDMIAKTFANFLDGSDNGWPALLPMVKSAVAAMDTTQAIYPNIENFIVTGGSKRGWTAWLTAAVDQRVSAIAPVAIDFLNLDESMAHHKRVYEDLPNDIYLGYSTAVGDYSGQNIIQRFDTPRGQELLEIVDPYEYRDRPHMDMPKYIISATGDEFFVSDSAQFYFDDLSGENNYLRYVPNANHAMSDDAYQDSLDFFRAVARGDDLPDFSWTVSEDGSQITVNTVDAPVAVKLWQATNPDHRDFRVATIGEAWGSSDLVDQGGGQYVANMPVPPTGATAFMVEMEYLVNGEPIKFTTEVRVVQEPDADFDQDGDVDGGDFLTWQRNFGMTSQGTLAQGDSNVDWSINAADLTAWEDQFGGVSALSAASVPEPSALLLLGFGSLMVLRIRRTRRMC